MILFYLLISVMPLSSHPLWGRFVGEMTVIKYVGAGCLLYAGLHLAARKQLPRYFSTAQSKWFLLFFFLTTLSYVTLGRAFSWESSPLISYLSFAFLFFIVLSVVDSLYRLRWVLLISVGSVAFASLYVIREWQKYHHTWEHFRPGWYVGDPNYYTVSALVALPLAFYLMLERRPRWERLFCLGCLVTTLVGVTLAASRGGFLGLIAAFLFVVLRSRQRVRNLVLASALLVPLSLAAPTSPLKRLLYPAHFDVGSTETRKALWKAGLRMVQENPVTGIGLGAFKPVVGEYAEPGQQLKNVAHNTYIEIAAELGLPGLVAFLGMLGTTFLGLERVARRTARAGPALLHQAALGIQGGLVGCGVSVFFVSGQYQKLFWLMVFLSMCLPPLVQKAKAAQQAKTQGRWPEPVSGQAAREGSAPLGAASFGARARIAER